MTDDATDVRLERTTFGQGSFGLRCSVCHGDDYERSGQVEHRPGCEELAPAVLELRGDSDEDEEIIG